VNIYIYIYNFTEAATLGSRILKNKNVKAPQLKEIES